MRTGKYQAYSFATRQKAMLAALLIIALVDLAVSGISVKRIDEETTEQMRLLTTLHTSMVYEECDRVGGDMRRILMENTDMTAMALNGTDREKLYAKGNLIDRLAYSFDSQDPWQPFFYFEQTGEVLGRSWLSLQEQRESGIVDEAIRQMTGRAELMTDLQKWVSFSYDDVYYMLRAYCYNDVWIACYVPADQLTDSLRQLYQEEACQVLLLHSDGEVLSGQEIVGQWQLDQRMLAEDGTYYRRHGGRIQVVKADSAKLDISIAVVMQGYGGFGKIVILQAAVLFLVLLTLGAFVLMTVYTRRRIIAPVQRFVRGLLDYVDHEADKPELSVSDIHELEQINEQFRRFVHQIGALKIDIYEEKLCRQKLELDNVKLQLKPHFFINNLSQIYRLLQMGRIEDAQKMCMAAIRYLRFLFSAGMDAVKVSETIAHVNDYFEIMKLRYPDETAVDLYVEEAAADCVLPPLMIQTLVENSFKYGKVPGKLLEISVTVEVLRERESLCINVSDNGKGYPEAYLQKWEKGEDLEQTEGRHIGIANIRARLQHMYGNLAEIRFYNSPMGGAVAEITVPMQIPMSGTERSI